MAITNAQQYKQLLAKGGRIGLKGGADASEFGKSGSNVNVSSSGSVSKSKSVSPGAGNSRRGDDGPDDRSSAYQTYNTAKTIFDNTGKNPTGYDLSKGPPPLTEKEKQFVKDNPPKRTLSDFFDPRKRLYNMFPNNPKNEKAYINYLKAQGLNLPQNILEMLDEEDKLTYDQFETLRNYEPDFMLPGEEGLYKPMDFPSYMASQGNFGLITKGNLGNLKDFKNPGTIIDPTTGLPMSDLAFDKLKQSSSQYSIGNNDRANEQQTDPCLGPNPPAYCAVNNDPTDPATPDRNLGGLAPRFAGSIFDFTGLANGGRAGAMDGGRMMMMANEEEDDPTGGIMDLESGRQMYFLGKLVKKVTRGVKKIAKSPVGKAALMYFGGNALMNAGGGKGLSSFFGKKSFNPFLQMMGKEEGLGPSPFGELMGKLGLFDTTKLKMTGLGKTAMIGLPSIIAGLTTPKDEDDSNLDNYYASNTIDYNNVRNNPFKFLSAANQGSRYNVADGGIMRNGYQEGGDAEPVAKKTMPLLDMDGQEMDLREEGGFVPLGRMERADDVPARLSKNEFVFTADAVRNAGEGDVDKGAEVMYNMMKNLESGGEVSEESQGLEGAREMFKTSQRLEEVI